MKYQFLIVGSGLYGAIWAAECKRRDVSCIVIEKRPHIGGNCFTDEERGIIIHRYGPHIFHTNNRALWDYVNQFAEFMPYRYRVASKVGHRLFSFPINAMTAAQLAACGQLTPVRRAQRPAENFEEAAVSAVGEAIYHQFFYGYTKKMWGVEPRDLPATLFSRLPIRSTWNDDYYEDVFQGMPVNGYTHMIENMLDGVPVRLGEDYLQNKTQLDALAETVVYSGSLDALFRYEHGLLAYRTLSIYAEWFEDEYALGVAAIHYPDLAITHTRKVEHKLLAPRPVNVNHTIVTTETPKTCAPGDIPMYPMPTVECQERQRKYLTMAHRVPNLIVGGRLASYRYMDMHQVVAQALHDVHKAVG